MPEAIPWKYKNSSRYRVANERLINIIYESLQYVRKTTPFTYKDADLIDREIEKLKCLMDTRLEYKALIKRNKARRYENRINNARSARAHAADY